VGTVLLRQMVGRFQASVFDLRPPVEPVEYMLGDVTDFGAVARAVEGVDAVVHLAYVVEEDPWRMLEVNLRGTLNVLEAMVRKGVGRVVYASSIAVYGYSGTQREVSAPLYVPVDEGHPCHFDSMHGFCKLAGEELCRRYTRRFGLSTICLRLGRVVSSGEVAPPDETVRREVLWGAVDIEDVASAICLALEAEGIIHETFNITGENALAPKDTWDLLRRHFPGVKTFRQADQYLSQPRKGLFDVTKARERLRYRARNSFEPASTLTKPV